jgi:hypothetical protein
MKRILLICLLLPGIVQAQKTTVKKSVLIAKTQDGNLYWFYDIPVMIENGHGEKVQVFFSATISTYVWKTLVLKNGNDENKTFSLMASDISLKAQNSLKNTLSFEPLKKQFFFMSNNRNFESAYMKSVYKMMGRNDYGNLSETSALVGYNPFDPEEYVEVLINDTTIKGAIIVPKIKYTGKIN